MKKPPPLTELQKSQLRKLEPKLKECVKTGDIKRAKSIAAKIQALIKPTGHTTRWMQNTNWLCECALESGDIAFAMQRLEGVRAITNENTRTHLEATAILAFCYIRDNKIDEAKVLVKDVLDRINNISSAKRRRQFHKRFLNRIEEECILSGMAEDISVSFDTDRIQEEAIKLQHFDKNGLVIFLGNALPSRSISLLEGVREFAIKQLPPADRKFLPTPKQARHPIKLGKRAYAALKRVTWRAVCDPNDEIYKAWSDGLSIVYDKNWITFAIIAACKSWNITTTMVVISLVALAFKMGAKTFCETFAPESIMIGLSENDGKKMQ